MLPGVASRLLAAFVREHVPEEIVSYADARWSDGGLYGRLGFEREALTEPGYSYWRPNTTERQARFKFRKDRLVAIGHGADRSEAEIMRGLGWFRISDCGSYRYRWRRQGQTAHS